MTAIDMTSRPAGPRPAAARPAGRIGAVVRLHLVNKVNVIGVPLAILGFVLLVNIAIWAILAASIPDRAGLAQAQDGLQWSGAAFYPFVYAMVVGILAVSATFPLALGFSVTRRDFYLGSALTYLMLSVFFGAIFAAMGAIETATGGWGFKGRMFTAIYFGDGSWYQRFLLVTAAFLFFFFIGTLFGAIYARWRVIGTLVFFGILTLLLVVIAFFTTLSAGWPAVGAWFVANGPAGVVAWSLVPTVLASVAGFAILRRATPRG